MSENEKEYVTVISPHDKDYNDAFVDLREVLPKTSYYSYPYCNTNFSLHLASEIKNGRIAILSSGERCRETFAGTLKNLLFGEKERRYYTANGWVMQPTSSYIRGLELGDSANVFIPVVYPYPKLKEQRIRNEEMATAFWNGASVSKRILNYLEDLTDWEERSTIYRTRITNMFPKGNHGSLLFAGAPQWFNTPYQFSLYLLICRLSINHFIINDEVKDVASLVNLLKGRLEEIKSFYTNKRDTPWVAQKIVTDVNTVIETAWAWESVVKNYKKVYGNKKRTSILDFYRNYTYNATGISTLCKFGAPMKAPDYESLSEVLYASRPKGN